MYTISLNDGESQSLEDRGLLKIQVFPVGTSQTDLRLTVTGDGVQTMNPNPTLAVVKDIPNAATITVTRASGGDFPIDQSVRVAITQGTEASVEFPIVRVGGVAEKLLGRIVHDGGCYTFTAFGSSDNADLPSNVMAVSSTLRAHLTTAPRIDRIRVMADTGATLSQAASDDAISAAVTMVRGIAGTLDIGLVNLVTGEGESGDIPAETLENALPAAVQRDRTRVGAEILPRAARCSADELSIYLTATPVAGMISADAPSLVLLPGANAVAEQQLYALSPDRTPRTGMLALTDELTAAVNSGDGAAFNSAADTVADVLAEREEVLR